MIDRVDFLAIAVWLMLGYLLLNKEIRQLIRHWRGSKAAALILLLVPLSGCERGPWVKAKLDAEVARFCAVDGGVKVYERVDWSTLSMDKFGRPDIQFKGMAGFADLYEYDTDVEYLKKGNPNITRYSIWIERRADGKKLGELVVYARHGGDLLGPWHDSAFSCPDLRDPMALEKSIFVKGLQ